MLLEGSHSQVLIAITEQKAQQHDEEERHRKHREPGAVGELGRADDDGHDGSNDGAEPVDEQRGLPAPGPVSAPIDNHPRLGQREGHEDAEGVERDDLVGVGAR